MSRKMGHVEPTDKKTRNRSTGAQKIDTVAANIRGRFSEARRDFFPIFRFCGKVRRDFAGFPILRRNLMRPISNLYGFVNVNVYANVNENSDFL